MGLKEIVGRMSVSFAIALTVAVSVMPVMPIKAATSTTETRYILGDGVRLRKEGWTGGTVLELMYNGEQILYYPDILGTDSEYNYMRRNKTGTYGYVDHHYTSMTKR